MSRTLIAPTLVLVLLLATGCGAAREPRPPREQVASPSIAPAPPLRARLRPPAEAILSDQAVGSPRRAGSDHLTAAAAASQQPDQPAALAEFLGWGWLDGSTRSWATADEALVLTSRPEGAARAFEFWAAETTRPPFAGAPCSPAVSSGLDDCRLGVAGDRALVVGRVGAEAFRLSCPATSADRLAGAQVASMHA
jgi:hypothetical protein